MLETEGAVIRVLIADDHPLMRRGLADIPTGAEGVEVVGAAFDDDLDRQPLGSALLVGVRITTPLASGASLTLAAENLTNRQYLSSVDRLGPPASVSLRLAVPLGARATTASVRCGAL